MELNIQPINIFDFDGTLTTETWPKFWVWVKKFGYSAEKRNNKLEEAIAEYKKRKSCSELESFFAFFHDLLVESEETLIYDELMEGEKYIQYHLGVMEFIQNSLAKNYIVSGGLKEFLENLKIAKCFDGIYGTTMQHNEKGLISGIGEIMTNDKKILAIQDILKKNNRKENDCQNVCYIGDGYSDAMAMRFVHNHGGKAIFVQPSNQNDKYYDYNNKIYQLLNAEGMVDYCCMTDYRRGSELSNLLQRQREEFTR